MTYLNKAKQGANYVFSKMCRGGILPYETGVEQGVYAAIFAQYMHTLVYECGQTQYLGMMRRNMQWAWDHRDQVRGISCGNFLQDTQADSQIDSYSASGMPAIMLLFPADDNASALEAVPEAPWPALRCIGCCSAVHRPSQRAAIATAARCVFPGVIVPAMVRRFSFMAPQPYLLPPGRMGGTPHRLPDASSAFLLRMATRLSGILCSPAFSCVNKSKSQTRWLAK